MGRGPADTGPGGAVESAGLTGHPRAGGAAIISLYNRSSLQTGPVLGTGVLVVIVILARQFLVVTDNRRLLGMLADQASHDPLTGLANRTLFDDRLTHAVQLHRRNHRPVAVLSLNSDDFKVVNDSMGHSAGDALLKAAAQRLRAFTTVRRSQRLRCSNS